MRHPGRILRHSAQADQKHIVIVLGRQMEMARAGGDVLILVDVQLQRLDPLAALEGEGGMGIHGCMHVLIFSAVRDASVRQGKVTG